MRTAELTLPGFAHDVCSAIHPLAVASPFLPTLPLAEHGVEWIESPAALAHPFDDGTAAVLERSVDGDGCDARRGRGPLRAADGAARSRRARSCSRPARRRSAARAHPLAFARFGARGALPATSLARSSRFAGERARALLRRARCALDAAALRGRRRRRSASCSALLGHAVGWPLAARRLADARRRARRRICARSAARSRPAGASARSASSAAQARCCSTSTPRQLVALAGDRSCRAATGGGSRASATGRASSSSTGRSTGRSPGGRRSARARRPCISAARSTRSPRSERAAWRGDPAERAVRPARPAEPLRPDAGARRQAHRVGVLPRPERLARRHDRPDRARRSSASRPGSAIGSSRARRWGRSRWSATTRTTSAATSTAAPRDLRQLFTRPVARVSPYTTPLAGVFLCSSSTPPGGGVHGMCGYHAAQAALHHLEEQR